MMNSLHSFDLSGKVALVTGASGGLGQAMAIGLAEAGADIIAVSYSESVETVKSVVALGRNAQLIAVDLSREELLDDVFDKALSLYGRIDILVNNAGIIRRKPAAEHPRKDWHEVIDLNLNSLFFLSQLVGNHMIERGSGKIINIASLLTYQGGINVPGYTASKHAVAGVTKALANEWGSKGIQVNAIAPGYMETNNTTAIRADAKRYASILERIPAARWGTPEDMKGPAIFLASSASDYLNGHVLCVDGGWMAR
jgi:2-deoxy-D-gluconate 3-dehydrogenase